MTTQLLIFGGQCPKSSLHWRHYRDGQMLSSGEVMSVAQLTLPGEEIDQVILILPGEKVIARAINSPAKSYQHIIQSAQYLLEDEIAENIDQYHLSVAEWRDDPIAVAGIAKAQLDEWLEELSTIGIVPDIVTADFLCLNKAPYKGVLLKTAGRIFANFQGAGFATDVGLSDAEIDLLLDAEGLSRDDIYFADYTGNSDMERSAQLSLFVEGVMRKEPINFLQGSYHPALSLPGGPKLLGRMGLLLIACLTLIIGATLIEGFRYNQKADAISSESLTAYQEAYPTETVRNLRAQARERANIVGATNQQFLEVSVLLARALQEFQAVQLVAINYDTDQLFTADLIFDTTEALDQFKSFLSRSGLLVEEGRTLTPVGEGYSGKLVLRVAG